MKKLTVKEKLEKSDEIIGGILYDVCHRMGDEKVAEIYAEFLQSSLFDIDKDIESEERFIKENPPRSTYASVGVASKKILKNLKNIRKEHLKLIKMWGAFVKQQNKITKMWRQGS